MKRIEIIRTPYGTNKKLAEEFGVKPGVISWALHGRVKSFRALEIRKRARQLVAEFEEEF